MRTAVWIIGGLLVLGAIVITLWPYSVLGGEPSVPGQYPVGSSRPEWPASEVTAAYRPTDTMGSDAYGPSGPQDIKMRCALVPTC